MLMSLLPSKLQPPTSRPHRICRTHCGLRLQSTPNKPYRTIWDLRFLRIIDPLLPLPSTRRRRRRRWSSTHHTTAKFTPQPHNSETWDLQTCSLDTHARLKVYTSEVGVRVSREPTTRVFIKLVKRI